MRARVLLLFLCTLLAIGCARAKAKSAHDVAPGAVEFDASLPRINVPSRARDTVAPAQHAASPLVTTRLEVRSGREPTRFEAVRIRGVVEGNVALTELYLSVRNLEERTVETTFTVNLPAGGAVTRFGMRSGQSEFQEGRIAEAKSAREAYAKLLQRGVDPGLVEIDGPDRVRVRLFPVGPDQLMEVMLTVVAPVSDVYRLPLAGTATALVDAQILVGKQVMTMRTNGPPSTDLVLPLGSERERSLPHRATSHVIVLVDTSASRIVDVESVRAIVKDAGDALLDVACFDQDVEPIHHGPGRSFDETKLVRREALGASDLGVALSWAAKTAAVEKLPAHVFLLTDNAHPLGPAARAQLVPLVDGLRGAGASRIDLVLDRRHDDRGLSAFRELGVFVHGAREPASFAKTPLGELGATAARLRKLTDSAEIRSLSLSSGILTRETAYVVLEAKEDYDEANITTAERKILTVGRDGSAMTTSRPPPTSESRNAVTVDRDADGIIDQVDRCPDDDVDDLTEDGCPEVEGATRAIAGRPGLLSERIRFAVKDAAISSPMRKLLDEMATALRQSPRVGLVEIAGHARPLGSPEESMRLADARANAVRAFLIDKGIAPDRLVARPYGDRSSFGATDADLDRVDLVPIVVDGKRRTDTVTANAVPPPHNGHYSEVAALLADKAGDQALVRAREWLARTGDLLAYLALGDALRATGDEARAARAYGSVLDLVSERPAEWRAALAYLDRLGKPNVAAYRRAHSPRGLAFALARTGQWKEAFEVALAAARENGPSRTDASLIGAAWERVEPKERIVIEERLVRAGIAIARTPSTQIVLTWESDATNVDLEISDAKGGKASRSLKVLRSGGEYRFDTRTGYGPDWFSIDGRAEAGPYRIGVAYTARGAMGPVLGQVSIVEHDGRGNLTFETRPFVLVNERASLDLGPLVPKRPAG